MITQELPRRLKVGDKLELVGDSWLGWRNGDNPLTIGSVVTVDEIDRGGQAYAGEAGSVTETGGETCIESYEVRLIEDTPNGTKTEPDLDKLVAVFKATWAAADKAGVSGSRTKVALAAVLAVVNS